MTITCTLLINGEACAAQGNATFTRLNPINDAVASTAPAAVSLMPHTPQTPLPPRFPPGVTPHPASDVACCLPQQRGLNNAASSLLPP